MREGRIVDIVNLYTRISFNFGPTLLSWLEVHSPEVYAAVIDADRLSARRFSGHGSAMAQVYNHMIMPLASRRDKVTQVRWGLADFRRRFGREPAGMWLPETAVDTESLEVLADEGIAFTLLAPRQAARVRAHGDTDWSDVGGWLALEPFLDADADGNAYRGLLEALDARDNIVFAEDPAETIALVGVRDLVVVRAGDRTLVVHRDAAEQIKQLVQRMKDMR